MYKVMIVDDEYYVRMDIRTMINWDRFGFALTEDAVDGHDALAKIGEEKPDILLLDIGMPGMNGITLLTRLKEADFPGRVIVLSCHDDFDYVKDALLLGAQDYLLKHKLEPETLEKALHGLIAKLEGERRHNEQLVRWQSMAAQSLQMQRKQFVRQLLHGGVPAQPAAADRLKPLELSFPLKRTVVLIVKIHDNAGDKSPTDSRSFEQTAEQIADEINLGILNPATGYGYPAEDRELHALLGFDATPSFLHLQNLLHDLADRILLLLRQRYGLSASIGVSNPCFSPELLPEYYRQARAAIAGVYHFGKNRIIPYSEASDYTRKLVRSFKEYEQTLLREQTDPTRIAEAVRSMYGAIVEQKVSLEEAKAFTFEFVSFLKKQQRDHGIPESDLFEVGRSPYEAVNRLETAEETRDYLTKVMVRLSELLPTALRSKYRPEIAKAIRYMKDNYAGDLSLETVAAYVNMNSTYFSNLFKKETEQNFVVFLQQIRMEKAKTLLRTTHDKVYDIASQVGIDNYQYFCKAFKQCTGMTPIQYRTKEMQ